MSTSNAISQTALSMIDGNIPLSGISFTAGVYVPQYNSQTVQCKGLYSKSGAVDVVVHPIRNAADVYFTCKLTEGVPFGIAFDKIIEAGTGALTHVSAIPV